MEGEEGSTERFFPSLLNRFVMFERPIPTSLLYSISQRHVNFCLFIGPRLHQQYRL